VEKQKIELQKVESRQILAIGHCEETSTLAVQFKTKAGDAGSTYHYANVPYAMYKDFLGAKSKGDYFGANIKKETEKHPFQKVPAPEKVEGYDK